jgi:CheY-like chemotaxis protein
MAERGLMRILVVDDESEFTDTLLARFAERGLADLDIVIARSRDSALELMGRDEFDLIICDLRIPTVDGALDAELVHGQRVYSVARATVPGTPVLVLSGYGDEQLVAEMAELAPHDDPFATGDRKPMLQYVTKHSDLEGCLTRVEAAAAAAGHLDLVNLSPNPEHLTLPRRVERVLRLFGRLRHGSVVRYEQLGGGLTEAQVLRVRVEAGDGALAALTVAKIAPLADVEDELRRFNDHVVTLTPGIFTPLMSQISAGAGSFGGAFYSLDEGFDRSLFDLVTEDAEAAASAVVELSVGTQRWREGRPATRVLVRELRRRFLTDDQLTEGIRERLAGTPWEALEQAEIQVRPCPQHRDLHGLNVLVDHDARPRMIDFGSVGQATAAVDPVTLEFSLMFHPAAPTFNDGWPSTDDLLALDNRPVYLERCPIRAYVEACRTWSIAVAGSNAEFFATAYGYAVRQLRYENTNKDFALAIIQACCTALGV